MDYDYCALSQDAVEPAEIPHAARSIDDAFEDDLLAKYASDTPVNA